MRCALVRLIILAFGSIALAQNPTSAPTQQQSVPQTVPLRPAQPSAPESAVKVENQVVEAQAKDIDLIWGLKIPMRDGVHLNGTVYRPHDQKQRLPVIFTLTPYIGDSYHKRAVYFAQNGYVFVLVDVRGRGNSEGQFEPFAHEDQDGHDVVEFLAAQPWSNGKITMWGGSYAGFDQWATLKELPPHLATIVPAAAAHAGVDFPFYRGIFSTYDMWWLTYTSGNTGNGNLFGETPFWIEKSRELYLRQAAFTTLDAIVGNMSTAFQKWLQHPAYDNYWQAMAPTREQYAKMSVPILTITGDYDGDQSGAMSYYREHMQYGSATAKQNHYLIIGPWDHAGTRTPNKEVGGLTFGEASMLDLNNLHKQWYDWTLKSGAKPDFLKKRVAYYVIGPGAENWKYADDLDSIAGEHRKLYLTSTNSQANDVFQSGSLFAQARSSAPDHFTYDPRDMRPAELEKEEVKNYLTDQRYQLNLFGNGVLYHSDPFPEATEISGFVKASLWMAMDVPDTDFSINVYEVLPDGASVLLTSDSVRARYRESTQQEKLVTPGQITRYDFEGFTWFSRRVSKGSRLRFLLTCPNTIYQEKNYNSGGVVASETGKDSRVAHVTVYHDGQHASELDIPVVH
ncbi:MAG: CocE/NonD family hydrolase [Terriglobales bacterium]